MSPYRHPTSKWLLSCLLPLLLWACSSYNPPATLAGISREALLAQMGQPDRERPTDGGSRLEFPRGPYGQHTWFVYLDANGQAIRAEQVLTEQNFNGILAGMTADEVRQLLGRPNEIQRLGRARGEIWRYRYESHECQWFQIEISLQQQVRSTGYGQPPECMGGRDIPIP